MTQIVPVLGENIPQRGTVWSRQFWTNLVRLQGWKVLGEVPNIPKAVMIGAPHTSNQDGVIGLQMVLAMGLEIHLMAKNSLYRPPFRAAMNWLKMMPIDRTSSHGLVEQMCHAFDSHDKFWLGLAPEGTRDSSETWKSGFYRIAYAAKVPIVMVGFDFKNKNVKFLGCFEPSGDFDADLPKILAFYKNTSPANPERLSKPLRML
ncbi:1-acyl-sn-glycerol-3-phosphate acyltransferase [Aquirhabdus sp.]|uniref:1-acyl-sn-glycerol-3-phosphate acyltransferase n=1 Tax=Aquirhabdus sp. TaxID=2824160 RepID=UPI00396C8D9D